MKKNSNNIEEALYDVYTKFKLNFYQNIFQNIEDKDNSLTIIENFCTEAIYALRNPTINELAGFINISQPNAAYKTANLVKKGYVIKKRSKEDKREYHLEVTEKFKKHYRINYSYIREVSGRISEKFTEEELEVFKKILSVTSNELMNEITDEINKIKYSKPKIKK